MIDAKSDLNIIFENAKYSRMIDELYKKAVEEVEGGKLYGREINVNDPKQVIAALYVASKNQMYIRKVVK